MAIQTACGGIPNHGFSFPTPDFVYDGHAHRIFAVAENVGPSDPDREIGSLENRPSVDVMSTPEGSPISYKFAGGEWTDLKQTTPFSFHNLPSGNYAVKITRTGYADWFQEFSVHLGDRVSLNASLTEIDSSHLKFYGFVSTPKDFKSVSSIPYTNIVGLVGTLNEGSSILESQISLLSAKGKTAYLSVGDILFDVAPVPDPARRFPDRQDLQLRHDYMDRWKTFVLENRLEEHLSQIAAIYLCDEPYWNNLTYDDLQSAAWLVKRSLPSIPIIVVEAAPAINGEAASQYPPIIDWLGYDNYGIRNPETDIGEINKRANLKNKLVAPHQRILSVADTWFSEGFHRVNGLTPEDMANVFRQQANLALIEPLSIGLMNFAWISDPAWSPNDLLAQQLPLEAQRLYSDFGNLITKAHPPSTLVKKLTPGQWVGEGVRSTSETEIHFESDPMDSSVHGVSYFVDGQYVGSDLEEPYSYSQNLKNLKNGSHVIEYVSFDRENNSSLSVPLIFSSGPGTARVSSTPVGAEILFSYNSGPWSSTGALTEASGRLFSNLTPGTYQVKLVKSGYVDLVLPMQTLTAGGSITFSGTMVAR